MAESPGYNQVTYTAATPDAVLSSLSLIRAPGWLGRPAGPQTIMWTHRYMSTVVLVVGIILLLTTLIGGLLLLARSEESLMANVTWEGNKSKLVISGSADQYMVNALFMALNGLPPAA